MKLTTPQAAAQLGIGSAYVAQLCAAGRIKAVKVGRDWLLTPAALSAYRARARGAGRPKGK